MKQVDDLFGDDTVTRFSSSDWSHYQGPRGGKGCINRDGSIVRDVKRCRKLMGLDRHPEPQQTQKSQPQKQPQPKATAPQPKATDKSTKQQKPKASKPEANKKSAKTTSKAKKETKPTTPGS